MITVPGKPQPLQVGGGSSSPDTPPPAYLLMAAAIMKKQREAALTQAGESYDQSAKSIMDHRPQVPGPPEDIMTPGQSFPDRQGLGRKVKGT